MKLTIIGSSGSFPGPDSPASCYLVEHEGHRIVLDMGNGSLGPLQRYTDIYDLDGVILSHLHVDHFIDLCSYYVALRYRPQGPCTPIPVWGPSDTEDRLVAAYGMAQGTDMTGELDMRLVEPRFTIGPFEITTALLRHPVEARGIRVSAGGRSITYSGDTGYCPELVDLSKGSDLALFEASFLTGADNPPDLHMTGAEAARSAAEADVGRLILTHLVPWNSDAEVLAEAQPLFARSELAAAGLVIDLS